MELNQYQIMMVNLDQMTSMSKPYPTRIEIKHQKKKVGLCSIKSEL